MKRQGRLARTSPSPSRLLPIIGCLVAGLAVALTFVLVLPGCAPQTSRGLPPAGRGPMAQPAWPGVYEIMTKLDLEPAQLPGVRAVLEEAEDAREDLRGEMAGGAGGRPDPSAMTAMRSRMAGRGGPRFPGGR